MFRLKEEILPAVYRQCKWAVVSICLSCLWAGAAFALGTTAGTSITNTATVDYTLGSDPTVHTNSATDNFNVVEIIDVVVIWQDGSNVPVNSPLADAVLTYQIINTGNGPEDFQVSAIFNVSGDDFNPTPALPTTLWIESNSTIGLQTSGASPDTPLAVGGSISLNADATAIIYLLSDIPGGLADTQVGHVQLNADAATPGAAGSAAGTELSGAGVGGDAMVGSTNADGSAQGSYEVSAPQVALTKSIARIVDPYGGSQPYTSAIITYRILVDVTGIGLAEGLVITDVIPVNTTFVAGSITLDGAAQTDPDDAPTDTSDFNVTAPDAVTVVLGDTVAPATRTIEFSVTID